MRNIHFYLLLALLINCSEVFSQCDFIKPPAIKKVDYASREFTFSKVTMNGKVTTYLEVEKGEKVKISTYVSAKQKGDYCPSCIVQVYWGIRGYASECAKSFYGYQFSSKKSTLKFKAPTVDGIYYITMGGTLDYSCKNNINRPNCSANEAFAVLKVGNPDPEKRITFEKSNKGATAFLKTTLVKQGCFLGLDQIEWFYNDVKLPYKDQDQIPLKEFGTYKVVWSNCLSSASNSYKYTQEEKALIKLTVRAGNSAPENTNTGTSIETSDKFVLETLIFDLGQSEIKPESEAELNRIATIMMQNVAMRILLEGHTDRRGNAKKNQVLSEQRVAAAKAYLAAKGVKEDHISTKGWGHQKPLVITNDVEKGKINRRVEITVLAR